MATSPAQNIPAQAIYDHCAEQLARLDACTGGDASEAAQVACHVHVREFVRCSEKYIVTAMALMKCSAEVGAFYDALATPTRILGVGPLSVEYRAAGRTDQAMDSVTACHHAAVLQRVRETGLSLEQTALAGDDLAAERAYVLDILDRNRRHVHRRTA